MRRATAIILGLLACLILLPLAAVAVLAVVGVDRFRPWIEARASEAVGRRVTLAGPLDLDLGLHPAIVLRDVALDGPEAGEPMLRARLLEARVRLWSLVDGPLDVERVRVDGLDLALSRDQEGRGNWELGGPSTGGGGDRSPSENGSSSSRPPLVRDLLVTDSNVKWRPAPDAPPVQYVVEEVSLATPDPALPSTLKGNGRAAGFLFAIEGEVGPLATLPSAGLLDLRASHGPSDLAVALNFAETSGRPRIAGKVDAKHLDLRPFASAATGTPRRAGRTGEGGGGAGTGAGPGEPWPTTPLDLRALHEGDLDLALSIGQLTTTEIVVGAVASQLRLEDGKLTLAPSRLEVASGEIRLSGTLTDTEQDAALALDVAIDRLGLGQILPALGQPDLLDSRGDLRLRLEGRGRSVAALVASLEGHLLAGLAEGRIKPAFLDRLLGGGRDLADALLGGRADDWVLLRCGAFELPIMAGRAQVKGGLLDTQLTDVRAAGEVDLARQRLDLRLAPVARAGGLELAVPVSVTGSFAKPDVSIAKRDAAARAALDLLTGGNGGRPVKLDAAIFTAEGMATNACLGDGREPAAGPEASKPRDLLRNLEQGVRDLLGRRR